MEILRDNRSGLSPLLDYKDILRSDISYVTTKAPCEATRMGERHVRIELSAFVTRTFVLPFACRLCRSYARRTQCISSDKHTSSIVQSSFLFASM